MDDDSGAMKHYTYTKAQQKRMDTLESKYGYDISHHDSDGNPVLVLRKEVGCRADNVFTVVLPNGHYRPA